MLSSKSVADTMRSEVVSKLKERYGLHPVLFISSLAKANSLGDLFDILDTFPSEFPVRWDEQKRRWLSSKDLFPSSHF
jgi:hypothetical protein